MSVRLIHRPARASVPPRRPDPSTLATPPVISQDSQQKFPLQTLLPVLGSLSSITMIVVMRANPIMVVVGIMILVVALGSGVAMMFGQRGAARRQSKWEREQYLAYLDDQRAEHRDERRELHSSALALDPDPASLPETSRNPARLWERRPSDVDFLRLRAGTGTLPWAEISLPEESNPSQPFDPIMASEAKAFIASASKVAGLPVHARFDGAGYVSVVGPPEAARGLGRALVAQAATLHSPDELQLGFLIPPEQTLEYPGAGSLPHALTTVADGPVTARRIAATGAELQDLLAPELQERAARQRGRLVTDRRRSAVPILILVDDLGHTSTVFPLPTGTSARDLDLIFVHLVSDRLHEPEGTQLRLTLGGEDGSELRVEDLRADAPPAPVNASADRMQVSLFGDLTARLSGLRLSRRAGVSGGSLEKDVDVMTLLGLEDLSGLGTTSWAPRHGDDFLRIPIAIGDDGRPVYLDLKEAAQGGMGPHGLCVGATGSGKSELLRTLVLALAAAHSPEDLSMVLVDFKGGAAFNPFASLPHLAGLIDNLSEDPQLIERARSSIEGEILRRQLLLKDTGGFANITDYREARSKNPSMEAMPHLFLVIDEFGELLTAEPDFIDLLLQIGRIGRALGIHLLLSSQRLEGGRLRGLDTYLSYRIGLRTFSEQESSAVLNTPDAFHLPPVPGYGYLKVDTTHYTRFRAGYVSGPLPAPALQELDEDRYGVLPAPYFNAVAQMLGEAQGEDAPRPDGPSGGPSLIDTAAGRLKSAAAPAAPVWLPPLPSRVPILQVAQGHSNEPLRVPVGIVDDPAHQAQKTWEIDLTASGGHLAVIGAPQTGRSTFLRSLVAGASVVSTPETLAFYALDLTGAGLARLEAFPQVGGVATRGRPEHQTRLLEELRFLLAQREEVFRTHHVESLGQFRHRVSTGEITGVGAPDVVLLVDGFALTREEFEHLQGPLTDLLTRGGSFGLHLVLALNRWNDMTMRLQPLIGQRVELRLNDPSESSHKRKLAEIIRPDQAGRALTDDGLFAQVALPTADDVADDAVGDSLSELAQRATASWTGPGASPIRLLPTVLDPATLPGPTHEPRALPLGLAQDSMSALMLELGGLDQHLLVFGDTGSGKTTAMRQVLASLVERRSSQELVIALMEPRGALSAQIPEEYLGAHARNATMARRLAASLAEELTARQEAGASTQTQIVIAIDDYDMLSVGGNSPLDPLIQFLPAARDLNFSVVLTRPVAGSARALFEVALQTLKDTGGTGLVLAGDRSEGQLWPGVYASQSVPGRGKLVRRGRPAQVVQVAKREAL